jgi:ketosteroid isomerase-like protein
MPDRTIPPKDVLDIHATAHAFFTRIDRFDDEAVIALMAPEFEWVRANAAVIRDIRTLRETLAARSRARVTRHLVTNVEIRAYSPDKAQVDCDILVFEKDDASESAGPALVSGPSSLLSSSDELVKVEGEWRIARKQARAVFKIGKSP